MTAALVLQHLYYLPNQGEIEISMREMAREYKNIKPEYFTRT